MKKIYVCILAACISMQLSCKKTEDKSPDPSKKDVELVYDKYYWSDKRKIPLATDSTSAIFLANDTSALISKLKKIHKKSTFQILNSGYVVIRANERFKLESAKEDAINAQYSYLTQHVPLTVTGEIIVFTLPGTDIYDLIKSTKSKLSITSNKYANHYLLKVEDSSSVVDVSNFIYESGLVQYCHPNFLADFISLNN